MHCSTCYVSVHLSVCLSVTSQCSIKTIQHIIMEAYAHTLLILSTVLQRNHIKQSLILQLTFIYQLQSESETSDPPLESPSSAPVNPGPHAVSESVKYIGGFSGRLERPDSAFILNNISSTWYCISAIVNSCNTSTPVLFQTYETHLILEEKIHHVNGFHSLNYILKGILMYFIFICVKICLF